MAVDDVFLPEELRGDIQEGETADYDDAHADKVKKECACISATFSYFWAYERLTLNNTNHGFHHLFHRPGPRHSRRP